MIRTGASKGISRVILCGVGLFQPNENRHRRIDLQNESCGDAATSKLLACPNLSTRFGLVTGESETSGSGYDLACRWQVC